VLPGARRGHHRDRQILEPACQIQQEPNRRVIGPLQVIDDQHHRCRLREVAHQPVQPMGTTQLRVGRLAAVIDPERSASQPSRSHKQRLRFRPRRALQQLARHAIRERALQLPAPCVERADASGASLRSRGAQQRTLADPRRSLDHHQRAHRTHGTGDRGRQHAKIPVSFDQGRPGRPRRPNLFGRLIRSPFSA